MFQTASTNQPLLTRRSPSNFAVRLQWLFDLDPVIQFCPICTFWPFARYSDDVVPSPPSTRVCATSFWLQASNFCTPSCPFPTHQPPCCLTLNLKLEPPVVWWHNPLLTTHLARSPPFIFYSPPSCLPSQLSFQPSTRKLLLSTCLVVVSVSTLPSCPNSPLSHNRRICNSTRACSISKQQESPPHSDGLTTICPPDSGESANRGHSTQPKGRLQPTAPTPVGRNQAIWRSRLLAWG